jgi:heterodisulfide reductase subunit A-like polyferredoxin
LPPLTEPRVYGCDPLDSAAGSAAAAQVLSDLSGNRSSRRVPEQPVRVDETIRIGVFVCRCGGEISEYLDTAVLSERALTWPNVVHSREIDFSCTPEAAQAMREAMTTEHLNRAVLAACSCCAIDQVCDSCSYQRVRCKRQLGVFEPDAATRLPSDVVECVNIREHCAWPHSGDRPAATAKAAALVAAAAARAGLPLRLHTPDYSQPPHVLIFGSGDAGRHCLKALNHEGITAVHVPVVPSSLQRADGQFLAEDNGTSRQGTAVVLAPSGPDELRLLWGARQGQRTQELPDDRNSMPKPGIFLCQQGADPLTAGRAAAARIAAWIGRISPGTGDTTAAVDADRCRACSACIQTCENGAPSLTGDAAQRHARIDPAACTGCGSCAATCPSGAITLGSCTDEQIEATIEAILG